jgi:hypothetical protein
MKIESRSGLIPSIKATLETNALILSRHGTSIALGGFGSEANKQSHHPKSIA